MFDSRGLPDYPPPHNAWQFPPPKVSPGWKWVAIAASVLGLIAGTSLFVVIFSVGSSGMEGVIDDPDLISVIEDECDAMTNTVTALPIHGSPRRQAQSILRQNVAVVDMVHDIRDQARDLLTSDPPSEDWLRDWDRLVEARRTYADALVDGEAGTFDVPTDSRGKEITERMNDAFIDDSTCHVPDVLVDLDPGDGSDA
ncbi:hypothetical protein ASE12_04495 [Aeromicrobium sp. Root236]|uniref:hypothetical protein n=1 Tax=Aeromicrobium sp. Root236 TaxID=1736498 RepID=UPI0006FCF91B|nr:hypothetical protein [Aeromicrobium sp. Root236]KRC64086.1 hypothetical protein ASE12_04495 [Aeromicrobium sp. Root236]